MGACSDYFSPTQRSRLMSGSDSVPSHISIEEVRPGYAVDAGISIQCFNYILGRLHKIMRSHNLYLTFKSHTMNFGVQCHSQEN